MPQFKPFRGVRYDTSRASIAAVTAPPYDVIDPAERAALLAMDPHNVVRIDLPDEADGPDRYEAAARTYASWLSEGVLRRDDTPGFYVYRMDYTDDADRPAHTVGVLGALALSRPGEGEILPHEFTTPKAKTDRLDLLRATRVNLSTIWALSLTGGLTELCRVDGPANETWTDPDGVTHSLWYVTDPARCAGIADAVAASPVVVADGHHRYETSVTYFDERRAADDDPEGAAYALCYVVELTAEELTVRPIHRLVDGVDAASLDTALDAYFTRADAGAVDATITDRMADVGALCLVRPDGTGVFLIPRPDVFDDVDDLDSARLARALEGLAGVGIRYQHGVDRVLTALSAGDAAYGVLLRPATVDQIEQNAHSGRRMPPKTTFFHPKPRTGQVFRPTD